MNHHHLYILLHIPDYVFGRPGSAGMSWILVPIIRVAVGIERIEGQYSANLIGVDLFTRFVNELQRDFNAKYKCRIYKF